MPLIMTITEYRRRVDMTQTMDIVEGKFMHPEVSWRGRRVQCNVSLAVAGVYNILFRRKRQSRLVE